MVGFFFVTGRSLAVPLGREFFFGDLLQREQESSAPLVQWKIRSLSPWAGTARTTCPVSRLSPPPPPPPPAPPLAGPFCHPTLPCPASTTFGSTISICLVVFTRVVAVKDADFQLVFVGVVRCLALVIDEILLVLHTVRFIRRVAHPLSFEECPTSHHVLGIVQRLLMDLLADCAPKPRRPSRVAG